MTIHDDRVTLAPADMRVVLVRLPGGRLVPAELVGPLPAKGGGALVYEAAVTADQLMRAAVAAADELTAVAVPPRVGGTRPVPPTRRTAAEVRAARRTPFGCCDRCTDNRACDCLRDALTCTECGDSGYAVHPRNGRRRGVRCPRGCAVRCSVCARPDCDNPGGQH